MRKKQSIARSKLLGYGTQPPGSSLPARGSSAVLQIKLPLERELENDDEPVSHNCFAGSVAAGQYRLQLVRGQA